MADIKPLSESELSQALQELNEWNVQNGKLHTQAQFTNFIDAFAFMTKVAIIAEGMGHHPEWFNVYNRVTIDLVTHDAGNAISKLDVDLAERINEILSR